MPIDFGMAWYEEPGLADPSDAPSEGERIDEDRDEEEDPSAETALREVISILLWLRFFWETFSQNDLHHVLVVGESRVRRAQRHRQVQQKNR